ncbi:hypothetical protein NBRC111894_3573 [Sporolactobacillus inulinus]|uniref:Uncharacterized protein n=1 Tax=Sporolactobacillus inulinus TaxID=2078 RepID=A0A4Y1ZG65_9BACL|nr:hypothetical protein NBRC111894_3573 [Sporolactobacillus inulinus]
MCDGLVSFGAESSLRLLAGTLFPQASHTSALTLDQDTGLLV